MHPSEHALGKQRAKARGGNMSNIWLKTGKQLQLKEEVQTANKIKEWERQQNPRKVT